MAKCDGNHAAIEKCDSPPEQCWQYVEEGESHDSSEPIVIDDTSIAYAKQALLDTKLSTTNSNLFSLIWVCVVALLKRGCPPSMIFHMLMEAEAAVKGPKS